MAIDIFPKAWSIVPPITAKSIPGHSLCPRHGFLFDGAVVDIVRGVRGTPAGTPGTVLWSSSAVKRYPGKAREHSGISDFDQLGLDSLLLPTGPISIVLGYQKTDTTNRNSVAFGTEGAAANACHAYLPHSASAAVIFDYGGEGGGNRISAGIPTAGDDIWTFTVGVRGMEMWQNYALLASNANNNTRTQGGVQFQLGRKLPGPVESDFAKFKFMWIYHYQLTTRQIYEIVSWPFQWVDPRP